ncbi:hypothetical protein DY000_02061374 [Brassica cretica]|uniref:Uncharacterized protein n=1 Tax=Brassica cretica TaxID=69181 RepID=A0ABQ7B2X2_BRACR|nr:hypothetical protein DY000_02061374 [Brassica cretica]
MKTHRSSLSEFRVNSKPQHKWWLWTVADEVYPSSPLTISLSHSDSAETKHKTQLALRLRLQS